MRLSSLLSPFGLLIMISHQGLITVRARLGEEGKTALERRIATVTTRGRSPLPRLPGVALFLPGSGRAPQAPHVHTGMHPQHEALQWHVLRPLCPAGVGQPLLVHHENRRVGPAEDFGGVESRFLHPAKIFRSASSAGCMVRGPGRSILGT